MLSYKDIIVRALREDVVQNDISTLALDSDKDLRIMAEFVAKQEGVICGMDIAREVFCTLDKSCALTAFVRDGEKIRAGQIIAEITGPMGIIQSAERTALNFITHLSGIATLTSMFVEKTKGTPAKIYDTRKTLPGMRALAKHAVKCGGGHNHRMNLAEMAMIKDNHLKVIKNIQATVKKIKKIKPEIKIEIECENLAEVKKALSAGADIIMLDNMSVKMIQSAVEIIRTSKKYVKKAIPQIEVSGGVNLDNVRKFAKLGIDRIAVGAITHSAPSLDISLEIIRL